VRVALRTQQIIAHESGVAESIDPLAGSYLVEHLTDEIETKVDEYLHKIDALGGALNAIETNYIQGEIQEAAYRYQQAVETGEEILVGVNQFVVDEPVDLEPLKVDPTIEAQQRSRLSQLREVRDSQKASELLVKLEEAARGDENLVPVFITCVENHLTLGEICGTLRRVWGEYQAPVF
jgi:methylmalonyl-CoA mutase N-terminal domain/subunit